MQTPLFQRFSRSGYRLLSRRSAKGGCITRQSKALGYVPLVDLIDHKFVGAHDTTQRVRPGRRADGRLKDPVVNVSLRLKAEDFRSRRATLRPEQ
jgi:hypothetical protein